jgi:DNA-binding transcriptional regulator YiaG
MTCIRCGTTLTTRHVSRPYAEAGLTNVTLLNVEVRLCPRCRTQEVVLPQVEILHDRIAHAIVLLPSALTPSAIRFIRTWLGLTCRDLALAMGVRHETAFRWERLDVHYPMGGSADRLLRMLVANRQPVEPYPTDLFKHPSESDSPSIALLAPAWDLVAWPRGSE